MGIINPRPAMRSREELLVRHALDLHAFLADMLTDTGMDRFIASRIAFNIVTTSKKRMKIWRGV